MYAKKRKFCKREYKTKKPGRNVCYSLRCMIKLDNLMFRKKGLDPYVYFHDLIDKGAEEKCWLCEKVFKPSCRTEFFTKLCKDCKRMIREDSKKYVYKEIIENPGKFLD